jgi:hypothetical protein
MNLDLSHWRNNTDGGGGGAFGKRRGGEYMDIRRSKNQ